MSTLPNIPGTDPSKCIFDSFRAAIARQVADALPPLTPEQVYTGVDYGKKGEDFTIALPRFRLPGKPDDLGKKVVENVSVLCLISRFLSICTVRSVIPAPSSLNQTNGSNPSDKKRLFFTSRVERRLSLNRS